MAKDAIRNAAEAYADIVTLHGIMGFLESRTLSVRRSSAERRIIKICREQAQMALRDYDRFTAIAKDQ